MNEKLISVVIPVYNVEKFLNKCVESVAHQTYKNLEIILVDDGSQDNCSTMCDEWKKKDSRVKVIHKENGGLSDARNIGYSVSNGEYISFIDSDDWIDKDFYSLLALELDSGSDIAECAIDWCDEEGNTIIVKGFSEYKVLSTVEATQTLLREQGITQTVWNKIYKRECINGIFFQTGKYHEDNFWTWQIFLKSNRVSVLNKPMYHYVQRKNSIMGEKYSLRRLDALEAEYLCYNNLKNDDNFREIVVNRFVGTCMYQMQCALKNLNHTNKKNAIDKIINYIKKSDIKEYKDLLNSIWKKMYLKYPSGIAKIRNKLKIGF